MPSPAHSLFPFHIFRPSRSLGWNNSGPLYLLAISFYGGISGAVGQLITAPNYFPKNNWIHGLKRLNPLLRLVWWDWAPLIKPLKDGGAGKRLTNHDFGFTARSSLYRHIIPSALPFIPPSRSISLTFNSLAHALSICPTLSLFHLSFVPIILLTNNKKHISLPFAWQPFLSPRRLVPFLFLFLFRGWKYLWAKCLIGTPSFKRWSLFMPIKYFNSRKENKMEKEMNGLKEKLYLGVKGFSLSPYPPFGS